MTTTRSVVGLVAAVVAVGCNKGGGEPGPTQGQAEPGRAPPLDARPSARWIAQLDEPRELERAITELEHLCDPEAIAALGRAWQHNNRPIRVMQVMISLAAPLTPEEADAAFCTDFAVTGRPARWDRVLPFLKEAVDQVDTASQRSVDNAVRAAEAIGVAGLPDGIDVLIAAVSRQLPAKDHGQRVRMVAVAALGKFDDPRVIPVLTSVIRADPGTQPPQLPGAAINALGERPSAEALPVLLEAMYRLPLFFQQVQRGLVRLGPAAAPVLREILRGEHADTNALFRDYRLDRYCGDQGTMPDAECEPVAARDYYAAIVLGALRDQQAVPDLLAALQRPALPAYYQDWTPGPVAQQGVVDALRRIGAPSAGAAVLAVVADRKAEIRLRAAAASAYGFISRRGDETRGKATGLTVLAQLAVDNTVDAELRLAAAYAYACLADDKAEVVVLQKLATKYAAGAAKGRDPDEAAAYRGYQRVFEGQIAMVELAARCQGAIDCLIGTFDTTGDDLVARLAGDGWLVVDGNDPRTADDNRALVLAQIDRAMLELGRLGVAAAAQAGPLLDQITGAWHDDPMVRQAVMLALPKLASLPCKACQVKLAALHAADADKPALQALAYEAQLLAAYFSWAGKS